MVDNNINSDNVIVHAPYIINLANRVDEEKYMFYVDFFAEELNRVKKLGFNKIVLHPGSAVNCSREDGIKNIIDGLNIVFSETEDTIVLLETMAGKGSEIGRTFEEIRQIIDGVSLNEKLGVCLDTCHVYDAGYDIVNDLDGVLDKFDEVIGLDRLKAIHLNDSKNPMGSHKDRHEKIGEGSLGIEAITRIINHPKLRNLPFFLETPNEIDGYAKEIRLLREQYKM